MTSPSNLLARLDELKRWQEIQQEKLLKQHARKLEEVDKNFTTVSDYMSIPGLSLLDTSNELNESDHHSNRKTLEIETVLSVDNSDKVITDESKRDVVLDKKKVKRPFLRRGAGLVRFKMKPGEQLKTTKCKLDNKLNRKERVNDKEMTRNEVFVNDNPVTPLKRPELTIKPKATWLPVVDAKNDLEIKAIDAGHKSYADNLIAQINELALNRFPNSGDSSDCEEKVDVISEKEAKPSEQTLYERAIEKELQIFEDLERRAMNSSFCSTNSSIVRLLASTPQKCEKINEKCETNEDDSNKTPEVAPQECFLGNHTGKSRQQIGIVSEDDYVNLRETYAKEFGIDVRAFVRENLRKFENRTVGSRNEDEDEDDGSSVTSEDLQQTVTADQCDDEETWSECCTSERSVVAAAAPSKTKTVAVQTETKETKCSCEENFAKKLAELDEEIQNFRRESLEVKNLKREIQEEQRNLKRDRRKLEKEFEEERICLEHDLEQERKKLNKERMVFERYVKDQQNKPTKKERQEMTCLKVEVENLKETLKIKETRSATSLARLRNQIKSLEKENVNLKDDIDKLSKQNAKLAVNQQKTNRNKPSDTKLLHQINRSLSKLTGETDGKKKQRSGGKKKEIATTSSSESDHDSLIIIDATRNKTKSSPPEKDEPKENDRNRTNIETISPQNDDDNVLERDYERTFAGFEMPCKLENNSLINETTTQRNVSKTEKTLPDGTKEILYANGNVKTVSPDGNAIRVKFFNGDSKETLLLEGVIKYFYAENKIWHTTYADGRELLEFPDGQTEKRFPDGSVEVRLANGLVRQVSGNGAEKVVHPDGTVVTVSRDGEKVMLLPNGQREIHTREHMRREYPDGTVKIVYPDGLQETRYANGRVRLKNKDGELLMDSHDETIC